MRRSTAKGRALSRPSTTQFPYAIIYPEYERMIITLKIYSIAHSGIRKTHIDTRILDF